MKIYTGTSWLRINHGLRMSLMECGKCFCEQGENNSIVDWDKWLCQTFEGRENPSMSVFPTSNSDDKTFHREISSRIYLNFFGIFFFFRENAFTSKPFKRWRERSQRCVLRISRVYCWCYCLPNTKKLSLPNKVSHLMCRTRAPTAEFIEESENSRLGNSPTIPFVLLFWFITWGLLLQAGIGGRLDKKLKLSYDRSFTRNRT